MPPKDQQNNKGNLTRRQEEIRTIRSLKPQTGENGRAKGRFNPLKQVGQFFGGRQPGKRAGLSFNIEPRTEQIDTTIPVKSIGTPRMQIPQTDMTGTNANIFASLQSATDLVDRESRLDELLAERNRERETIEGIFKEREGLPGQRRELEESLDPFKKEVNELRNLISQKASALRQGLVNEEGRPIPMEFITGRQAEMRKQAAIEMDALSAAYNAANDNLALAQDNVDRLIRTQFDTLEAQMDTREFLLKNIQGEISDELKAEQEHIKMQRQQIENGRKDAREIFKILLSNAKNLSPSSIQSIASQVSSGNFEFGTIMGQIAASKSARLRSGGSSGGKRVFKFTSSQENRLINTGTMTGAEIASAESLINQVGLEQAITSMKQQGLTAGEEAAIRASVGDSSGGGITLEMLAAI